MTRLTNGGIIGKAVTAPTPVSAIGKWNLSDQHIYKQQVLWTDTMVTSGLITYLDPARYSGSGTILYDISGNNNNFTIVGGLPWTSNGLGSYFTSAADASKYIIRNPYPFPTTAVTYELWISSTSGTGGLVSYAGATDNEGLLFDTSNILMYGPGSVSAPASGVNINGAGWKQVVFTSLRSNGESKLYINSSLSQTATISSGSNFSTNGSLVIGQEQDSTGGGFDSTQSLVGKIGIFRLYNRVLSQSEIDFNFSSTSIRYGI